MSFETILIVANFIDICTINIGQYQYLVTISNDETSTKTKEGMLFIETAWNIHAFPPMEKKLPLIKSFMPVARGIDCIYRDETLWAIVENNYDKPAYLLKWPKFSIQSPSMGEPEIIPVIMPREIMQSVTVPNAKSWSSINIPITQWLFNPSISLLKNGDPFIALNTADARAPVLSYSVSNRTWKVMLDKKNCLEPVGFQTPVGPFLFSRTPTPSWSVFFNSPIYGGSDGPKALPIALVNTAKNKEPIDLTESDKIGPAYLFDCAMTESGKFVMAVVTGTKAQPMAALWFSDYNKTDWKLAGTQLLPSVPMRCKLSVNNSGNALVGLVVKGRDGYSVSVWNTRFP